MDASNDLKFIIYGLIFVAGKNTMKNIIMQQNKFIEEMAIVTIQGIDYEKEDEGRYLLITTKLQLHRAQQESDHLLRKYFPEIKNPRRIVVDRVEFHRKLNTITSLTMQLLFPRR